MTHKKANLLFLIIIITHICISTFLSLVPGALEGLTGGMDLLLGQFIILIPTLIFVGILSIRGEASIPELLGLKSIRMGSVFMLILYTFLLIPLTSLCNAITMLFTDNTVLMASDAILAYPWYLVLLFVGIIGPACEELVFRGVIYGGMKKTAAPRSALLLSALAFGLMHMNVNQAVYAFVLGVFMALAVAATGSLWGSLIIHFTFNLEQMGTLLLYNKLSPELYSEISSQAYGKEEMYSIIALYMVISVVTTAIAGCVIAWVAKHENRTQALREAVLSPKKIRLSQNKNKENRYEEKTDEEYIDTSAEGGQAEGHFPKIITWHMVIAICIAAVYMVYALIGGYIS